ncbi:MAG: toll/interleukin-1 receptor domain-containing protein [Dysgonamonadaceae bacterium]|nr:toll/interleukin-1 receptor domain-containing protein [Dysgonamonadaceae bacterium]
MNLITEAKLEEYSISVKQSYKSINDSLREFRSESKFLKTKIFLSHKHDELKQLESAISFLNSQGVSVYVDWLDEGMPKTTSGSTAERIKEKIKENDKFILLATEGAINSKWCNWELGLGDAEKYIDNIALLPIKRDYYDFSGSEYLHIYPYIIILNYSQYFEGNYRNSGSYVVYPNNISNGNKKVVPLENWLKK